MGRHAVVTSNNQKRPGASKAKASARPSKDDPVRKPNKKQEPKPAVAKAGKQTRTQKSAPVKKTKKSSALPVANTGKSGEDVEAKREIAARSKRASGKSENKENCMATTRSANNVLPIPLVKSAPKGARALTAHTNRSQESVPNANAPECARRETMESVAADMPKVTLESGAASKVSSNQAEASSTPKFSRTSMFSAFSTERATMSLRASKAEAFASAESGWGPLFLTPSRPNVRPREAMESQGLGTYGTSKFRRLSGAGADGKKMDESRSVVHPCRSYGTCSGFNIGSESFLAAKKIINLVDVAERRFKRRNSMVIEASPSEWEQIQKEHQMLLAKRRRSCA